MRKDADGGADEAQGWPLAAILFPVSVGKHGDRLLVELPFRPCFPTLTGNRMTNAKRWTLRGSGMIVAVASPASASFAYSVSVFPFPFQCLNRRTSIFCNAWWSRNWSSVPWPHHVAANQEPEEGADPAGK